MKKFPFLEIGIAIAFAILLYILIYPSYKNTKDMNNKYDVISNTYAFRAAYEKYATLDNQGNLPDTIVPEIIQYLNDFGVINPFTQTKYTKNDIQIYSLETPLDIADNTLSGKHGKQRGRPGTLAIGIFVPNSNTYKELIAKEKLTKKEKKILKGLNLEVIKYTIIGFDKDSIPVTLEDKTSKKWEVFFLQGQKSSID